MVGAHGPIDEYVAPTLRFVIGGLTVLGATFTLWASVRRKALSMALRGLGALVAGALLVLWGLRLIPDLFWAPYGPCLVGLSLSLIALGVLLGWARADKQARGTWRRGLCSIVRGVLICAGMAAVWLVAPPRYESAAVVVAALLFVLGVSLARRRRRPDAEGSGQLETQRKRHDHA
jgi:hypothetical protein